MIRNRSRRGSSRSRRGSSRSLSSDFCHFLIILWSLVFSFGLGSFLHLLLNFLLFFFILFLCRRLIILVSIFILFLLLFQLAVIGLSYVCSRFGNFFDHFLRLPANLDRLQIIDPERLHCLFLCVSFLNIVTEDPHSLFII